VEQYIDGLNLIRQEFDELEKQEHSREWRQNKVEAKYFMRSMEAAPAKRKSQTDPPTKAD
jgi:hypothetical protein